MHTPKIALGAAALTLTLAAQTTPDRAHPEPARTSGVRMPRIASPIHTGPADDGHEYGIWACGADYKVSFHGPMTFVPYLGADYPHLQPFAWTTQSVRIGATELTGGEVARRQETYRYEYDLGDVVEAYDVRAEGLEQTFVIARRPAGPLGDLVVEGIVDSRMTAASRGANHGPLDFFDAAGDRIFTYGAAFAVDARGAKRPMATAYADGVITLSLAATEVEGLVFPVTVDPLLGNVGLRTGVSLDTVMDCLREDEGTSNNLWYTYSRAAASGDQDLWVWRRDDDWTGGDDGAFQDLSASWSSFEPQLAFAPGADRVVTVFTRQFNSGRFAVRGHIHDIADTNLGNAITNIAGGAAISCWRPDVGGAESFSTPTIVMVVYQEEPGNSGANSGTSAVRAVPLNCAPVHGPQGLLLPVSTIAESNNTDNERPRINQQASSAGTSTWAVVYQTFNYNNANDDWDVGLVLVNGAASITAGPSYTENGSPEHKLGPVVAGQDGRYAVLYAIGDPSVYVSAKPEVVTGEDLRIRRVDASGGSISWNANLSSLSELGYNTGSLRWEPGGLAYDTDTESHWMATMRSTQTDAVYCVLAGYRGGGVLTEQILDAGSGDGRVGGVSYDDDNARFALLAGDDATGRVVGDLWGYEPASAELLSGVSCHPATLSWSASGTVEQQHAIGHEFATIGVTGAQPTDVHFMVLSLASDDTPVMGPVGAGCRLLVNAAAPHYLGVLDFRVGANVSWPQSIPEFLLADTVYFQDWIFDGSRFLSTQRMAVDIVK